MDVDAQVEADYRRVAGHIIAAIRVSYLDDGNWVDIDAEDDRPFLVRVDPCMDGPMIHRWMDKEYCDPLWAVEPATVDPRVANLPPLYVYGPSYSTTGERDISDLCLDDTGEPRIYRVTGLSVPA